MVLNMKERVLWLLRGAAQCAGQTLVEYSLILAFVAAMIVALGVVVGGTNGLLSDIEEQLTSALS
jgi:Flp pilus assembly pilin Flp